jgi:ElaB/YqjD/DUF883 family membrane-anchored ribosome-binding protein
MREGGGRTSEGLNQSVSGGGVMNERMRGMERGGGNVLDSVTRYTRRHPWTVAAAAGGVVAALGAGMAARRAAPGGGGRVGEMARDMGERMHELGERARGATHTARQMASERMSEASERMQRSGEGARGWTRRMGELRQRVMGGTRGGSRAGYFKGASMVGHGPQLP